MENSKSKKTQYQGTETQSVTIKDRMGVESPEKKTIQMKAITVAGAIIYLLLIPLLGLYGVPFFSSKTSPKEGYEGFKSYDVCAYGVKYVHSYESRTFWGEGNLGQFKGNFALLSLWSYLFLLGSIFLVGFFLYNAERELESERRPIMKISAIVAASLLAGEWLLLTLFALENNWKIQPEISLLTLALHILGILGLIAGLYPDRILGFLDRKGIRIAAPSPKERQVPSYFLKGVGTLIVGFTLLVNLFMFVAISSANDSPIGEFDPLFLFALIGGFTLIYLGIHGDFTKTAFKREEAETANYGEKSFIYSFKDLLPTITAILGFLSMITLGYLYLELQKVQSYSLTSEGLSWWGFSREWEDGLLLREDPAIEALMVILALSVATIVMIATIGRAVVGNGSITVFGYKANRVMLVVFAVMVFLFWILWVYTIWIYRTCAFGSCSN